MENFPVNSHNVLGPKTPKEATPPKDIQKVVTGAVIERPKPLGRRFKDLFVRAEFKQTIRYISSDVFIPALKNMIVEGSNRGVERLVFKNDPRGRRSSLVTMVGGQAKMSYNLLTDPRYAQSRAPQSTMLPGQPPRQAEARLNTNEIILAVKADAERTLEQMQTILDTYEVVSVADMYETLGRLSSSVDNKWGWYSLAGSDIRQVREGFLILLPEPQPI